ncbi:MAG: hypothetical protein ACLR4A_06250 [Christensenellales bacterium]
METMLESEAMAILVGAGVSYGRREAALRAAGGARWPFWKNRRRMPRSFRRGAWRSSAVRGRIGRACSTSWNARGWRLFRAGTNIIRRCFGTLRTRRTCSMSMGRRI